MSMNFPANPAVGDVHVFTDATGRKINFQWDGITWTRVDDPSPSAAAGLDLQAARRRDESTGEPTSAANKPQP
jgi:hypothetical protein